MPPADAVAILAQICRGLIHAHAAGVIHRDLKPGNVFLREDGQTKILDFGLARVEKALTDGAGERAPGGGTAAYMAPEQWRGEAEDERTDLFPCGVMLFEMLCGRLPYAVSESTRGDLEESRAGLGARMAGVPSGLVATIERALARDPAKRFGSAQELLDALVGVGRPEQVAAGAAQPYRYLEHFLEADAPWFFGREREAVRLEQMQAARPLVALVGPSGAGKSSLIHAGLVPRLRRTGKWTVIAMRPGSEPLRLLHQRLAETCGEERARDAEQLAEAPGRAGRLLRLHARDSGTRVVLVVDQLEELITHVHSSAVRRAFVQALLSVADDPGGPTRVVVALRDDFLVRLSRNSELREALVRNLVLLGPPDAEGLADALRGPAARLGSDFESGLVDEMVAAVAEEPAPLPLLELAASRLWERRDVAGRLLTRAGLEAAGGVAGILAAHANEVLHGLAGQGEVTLARRLLCDLVTDEGTRRRVRREELLAPFEDPTATGRVLERLVNGRLVTSYHGERGEWVELVHESLITGWAQLREWLDEDRAHRKFREQLLAAATMWAERRRPKGLLWRGDTLDEALKWRRRYQGSVSAAEQAFLSRSEARQLRARRTRRGFLAVVAAVVLSVTVGLFIAVRSYRAAERLTHLRERMRAAGAADDPLVGALILAELQGQPEPPGGLAAAAQLAAQPIPLAVYRSPSIIGALSLDGKWAAVGVGTGADVWRADGTGKPIVLRGHEAGVTFVSFSRDGTRIATASDDKTVRIWRTDGTGAPIVLRHRDVVESAVFTPDDAHVLSVAEDEHVVRLWRADGEGDPVVLDHPGRVFNAAISADGRRVLTAAADGIRLWSADGTLLALRAGMTNAAHFSPDGTRILSVHWREMRVWHSDLTAPLVLPGALPPNTVGCYSSADEVHMSAEELPPTLWSPDGQRIAHGVALGAGVSRVDGTGIVFEMPRHGNDKCLRIRFSPVGSHLLTVDEEIRVWRADGGDPLVLRGGGARTWGLFSADGSRILTVSGAGSARVWPVGDPPGARSFHEEKPITSVTVSPDGRLMLTTSIDGTARLWPVAGGAPIVLGNAGVSSAQVGAFDPKGSRVAIGRGDGLWISSVAGGAPLARPIADVFVAGTAYSPDGAWLAAATGQASNLQKYVTVFRADGSGVRVKHGLPEEMAIGVSFSPDSSHVVMAMLGGSGQIWRADFTGEPVVLPVTSGVDYAVYHPHGEMIMTSSDDDKLQFWTLDGHERADLARPGGGPIAWSPDGERVAVGLRDGSVRITRLDGSDDPIVLRGNGDIVTGVAFLPDGRLATSAGTTVKLWSLDWRKLVASLRAATTACLPPAERIKYLDEPEATARAAWETCERRYGRAP